MSTITLKVTKYDGTPGTLPEEGKPCIVESVAGRGSFYLGHARRVKGYWWEFGEEKTPTEIGDLWAYWPEAPEVEA